MRRKLVKLPTTTGNEQTEKRKSENGSWWSCPRQAVRREVSSGPGFGYDLHCTVEFAVTVNLVPRKKAPTSTRQKREVAPRSWWGRLVNAVVGQRPSPKKHSTLQHALPAPLHWRKST